MIIRGVGPYGYAIQYRGRRYEDGSPDILKPGRFCFEPQMACVVANHALSMRLMLAFAQGLAWPPQSDDRGSCQPT